MSKNKIIRIWHNSVPLFIKVIIPVAIFAALEIYFINSSFKGREADYMRLDVMRQIQILDEKIDAFLGSKVYYRSFDEIARATNKFDSLLDRLIEKEYLHSSEYEKEAINVMVAKFSKLKNYIESYKSLNGLITNSMRYSMTLHTQIETWILMHAKDTVKEKMLVMQYHNMQIMDFLFYESGADNSKLEENLLTLKVLGEDNEVFEDLLTNFKQHVNVIVDGIIKLHNIQGLVEALQIEDSINNFYQLLLIHLEDEDMTYTTIMGILQVLILLAIVFLMLSYKKEIYYRSNLQLFIRRVRDKNRLLRKLLKDFDQNVIASRTDKNGRITYVSKAFCKVSGYRAGELLGKNHNIVRHPDMDKSLFADLWERIQAGEVWQGEVKNRTKNGGFYWVDVTITPEIDSDGTISGYSSIRQLTTSRKAYEALSETLEERIQERTKELNSMVKKVEKLSITDELTGLYNRRFYVHTLEKEIERARRDKKLLFYLIVDIDNFKKYNDLYGHQQGDEVLKTVSDTLRKSFKRAGDTVFRMGGEEFVVIYSATEDAQGYQIAEGVITAIADLEIEHKGNEPYNILTISAGAVACNTLQEINESKLYKKADTLLYEAKKSGRNCLRF